MLGVVLGMGGVSISLFDWRAKIWRKDSPSKEEFGIKHLLGATAWQNGEKARSPHWVEERERGK